jgi:hypothetical protein
LAGETVEARTVVGEIQSIVGQLRRDRTEPTPP